MFEPIQIIGVFVIGGIFGFILSAELICRDTKITIKKTNEQIDIAKKLIKEYETSKN